MMFVHHARQQAGATAGVYHRLGESSPAPAATLNRKPAWEIKADMAGIHFNRDWTSGIADFGPANTIAPGEAREVHYEIQAPERINLTSESNRVSYAPFSGLYRRGAKTRVAHLPVRIIITQ